jgi:NhaA family Na+:H+ antiporter
MSIFVSGLAFTDPSNISYAKVGIIIGSIVSGIAGISVLKSTEVNVKQNNLPACNPISE